MGGSAQAKSENMNKHAILPIGPVTLKNGKNHMHGTVFACWSTGAFMVVQDTNGTFRGIASSGSVSGMQKEYPVSSLIGLKHDQTSKRIGSDLHTIVSHHNMSQDGLLEVAAQHKIGGLQMATFK
jgi:hypothetical protein